MKDVLVFEEILEFIWTQRENGLDSVASLLNTEEIIEAGAGPLTLKEMEKEGLIALSGDSVRLTASGEKAAEDVIRRHRLAERLLSDVLDVGRDVLEKHACSFEHSLSSVVADSICTMLGHPPSCPHGLPIPKGECCKKAAGNILPLVRPLNEAEIGQMVRIVFIAPKTHSRLEKLGSMGIVPGSVVSLIQKSPAFVVKIKETTLALDPEIVKDIFVRKAG